MACYSIEIRAAGKGDEARRKQIWKLCFGDDDAYIDSYFANRYKEDETLLLIADGEIVSMLTMIPVAVVTADGRTFPSAMQYAVATHPEYRGRGFVSRLMDFCDRHLKQNRIEMSVLVPAEERLFDFYGKRGYKRNFFIREVSFAAGCITGITGSVASRPSMVPASPRDYNIRRNTQLKGQFFVAYRDEEIAYQKMLSMRTGADIYSIDIEGVYGCAAVERINPDRVLIKELLMPEHLVPQSLVQIAERLPAGEYVLRLPAYQCADLGGIVRAFGMVKPYRRLENGTVPGRCGYLGIAFD
jgi:ribosomal protein S18 acetylase RimI-like enzyme